MYLCKSGQNPFTGSEDNARERIYTDAGTDAYGIQTKTNMLPPPPPLMWGGGHKHKLAYICKCEDCSHDKITYKFAHGV